MTLFKYDNKLLVETGTLRPQELFKRDPRDSGDEISLWVRASHKIAIFYVSGK